jgi:sec-independent protein translocase protein TatA
MGSIGLPQILLVLVIILIIFGAGKLPRVMGDVAKGIKNFRTGMKDDGETPEDANKQIDGAETVSTTQPSKDEAAKT